MMSPCRLMRMVGGFYWPKKTDPGPNALPKLTLNLEPSLIWTV